MMSRKVFWVAALAVVTIAVEFGSVGTVDAQLLRRNRCCAPTTTCAPTTAYCEPACRAPIRPVFVRNNNNCCAPTTCCAATTDCNTCCTTARRTPIRTMLARNNSNCCCPTTDCCAGNCGTDNCCGVAQVACTTPGCATSTDVACGCGRTIATVSYESDFGTCTEGKVEGCVGEGCGETIYESGDTVIESSDTSAPIEAPGVEATSDDKEA